MKRRKSTIRDRRVRLTLTLAHLLTENPQDPAPYREMWEHLLERRAA